MVVFEIETYAHLHSSHHVDNVHVLYLAGVTKWCDALCTRWLGWSWSFIALSNALRKVLPKPRFLLWYSNFSWIMRVRNNYSWFTYIAKGLLPINVINDVSSTTLPNEYGFNVNMSTELFLGSFFVLLIICSVIYTVTYSYLYYTKKPHLNSITPKWASITSFQVAQRPTLC